MQRTWTWAALAISGAWWLFMLPVIGFALLFPEPAASLGLGLAGLAWIGIALVPVLPPRTAPFFFVGGHCVLVLAVYLILDQAWPMLPQAMGLVAAVAAAIDLPLRLREAAPE